MHAWFSSHGRLQGGNDNKNAKNLHVKEIACLYMCITAPPLPNSAFFCPECFKVHERFSPQFCYTYFIQSITLVKCGEGIWSLQYLDDSEPISLGGPGN